MNIEGYMPLIKASVGFFLYTMVELAILFVGISFLVGVINEFLPQEKMRQWLSGRNGKGYLIASALGGLTPFCSCSTIPVTIGLLRANAGFGPTMAFLFTSPLVNPIIIPLFLTLLGPEVTIIYGSVAIVMVIGISFFLEKAGFARYVKYEVIASTGATAQSSGAAKIQSESAPCCAQEVMPLPIAQMQQATPCCASSAPVSGGVIPVGLPGLPVATVPSNRWKRIFDDAFGQFKKLLPFIILGVGIGAIIHGFLPADLVVRIAGSDNPLAVPASAIIGIPLYLRVSTMVPIAASLIAKGMSIGAVVALIIGGAGASLPEMAMLKGIFKYPLLIAFITSVMVMAISAGFMINFVLLQ